MRNILKLSEIFSYLAKKAKGSVISFDFDDTLWLGPDWNEYYLDKLKNYINEGYEVVIVTARDYLGARDAKRLLSGIGINIDVYSAPGNRNSSDREENITKSDVLLALEAKRHYDDMPNLPDLNKAKRYGIEIIPAVKPKMSVAKISKNNNRSLMTKSEMDSFNKKASIKFSDKVKNLYEAFNAIDNFARDVGLELILPRMSYIENMSNKTIGATEISFARKRSDYEVHEFGKDRLIKIKNVKLNVGWIKLPYGYDFQAIATHIPGTEPPYSDFVEEDDGDDDILANKPSDDKIKEIKDKQLKLFNK